MWRIMAKKDNKGKNTTTAQIKITTRKKIKLETKIQEERRGNLARNSGRQHEIYAQSTPPCYSESLDHDDLTTISTALKGNTIGTGTLAAMRSLD